MTIPASPVIYLQKAVQEDFPAVLNLIEVLEEQSFDPDVFLQIYQRILARPDHIILLANISQKENPAIKTTAGMLHMRMEEQLHHNGKVAEILELVVFDVYRSAGIGKALLDRAIEIAKECGFLLIECASNVRRQRAHHFYLKNGFAKRHFGFDLELTNAGSDRFSTGSSASLCSQE